MGANMRFYICSSPALEFYGWQRDLTIQNAHLDLMIVEVISGENLYGTLPELWGMKPMSKETEALIVKEDRPKPGYNASPVLPNGSLSEGKAWAGGYGFSDLENSCQNGNKTLIDCEKNTDTISSTV